MTNATPDSAAQTVYIQVTDESGARQTYPLTAAGLMIGEFSGSQIQLSGPGIARNHLWVRFVDGQTTVRLLSDAHRVRLQEQVLTPGQNHVWPLQAPLTVGRYQLMLTPTANPPLASTPTALPNAAAATLPAMIAPQANQPAPSTQLASDPVGIELAPNDVRLSITPGSSVNVPVMLHNRRSAPEQVQLILSGLPTNNYSIAPAEIDLPPNARRQIDMRVSLPDSPEITPGERTITIIAKSLTSPDIASQRPVTWVVKRFVKKPNVQIAPNRQMISSLRTFMRQGSKRVLGANYNVQIENLSNEREFYTIRVENSDPSISCSLQETHKSVEPGEKAAVALWVEPLAGLDTQRRLSSFKVLVRPDSQPAPDPLTGRLEHVTAAYALRRYAPLAALAGMVVLALLAYYFLVRPLSSGIAASGTATPGLNTASPNGESAVVPAPPQVDLGPLQQAAAATTTALAVQAQTVQGFDAGVNATQNAFATSAAGTSIAIATAFQATNVVIGTLQADATKGVGDAGATVLAINQQQTSTAQVAGAISVTGTALALQLAPTQTALVEQLAPTQTALAAAQSAIAQTQTAQPNPTLTAAAVVQTQIAQAQTAIASFTPQVLPPISANASSLLVGAVIPNIVAGQLITMTVSVLDSSGRLLQVNDIPIQLTLSSVVGPGLGLSGGIAAATVNGIATFKNLSINGAGTAYTISARSLALPSIPPAASAAFSVVPAPPAQLTVALKSNSPFTITLPFSVVVNVFDKFGNPATNTADSAKISIVSSSAITDVVRIDNSTLPFNSGSATFMNMVPVKYFANKIYQVRAETAAGNVSNVSGNFTINQLMIDYQLKMEGNMAKVTDILPTPPAPAPADYPNPGSFDIQYCISPNTFCGTAVPVQPGLYRATAKLKISVTNYSAPVRSTDFAIPTPTPTFTSTPTATPTSTATRTPTPTP